MFTPRLRSISRPALRAARKYSTATPPPSAPPPSSRHFSSSPGGRRLLIGATAISVAGLIVWSKDSAKNESASLGSAPAKVGKEKGSAKPVYQTEESSPAPAIVQRKENEAIESTQEASGSRIPSDGNDDASAEGGAGSAPKSDSANQGAFNEETGEINWDCPCLGGMADGPCGEQFKAAFSCFVYSEAEPKGVDCVEKFKAMQDCFRLHPDIYGEEIDDDEDESPATPVDDVAGVGAEAAAKGAEDVGSVDALPATTAMPASTNKA